MIRAVIFLILMAAFSAAGIWVAGLDGVLTIKTNLWVANAPLALAVGALTIALVLLIMAARLLEKLAATPRRLKARLAERNRKNGMAALTRGLAAVAAGDPGDARRAAEKAKRLLNEPAVTRLLAAQAAHLDGDDVAAEQNYSEMLDDPETEFLGLRGLYLLAQRAGDEQAAIQFAEKAFKLRPTTPWAFESLFELYLARGAWGDARQLLEAGERKGLVPPQIARRRRAVLLTADAYAADAAGDEDAARDDALAAGKLAPEFSPASLLAARRLSAGGHAKRAAKVLEGAWAAAPHSDIAKAYAALNPSETETARHTRLEKLADKAPDANLSKLLRAEIALGKGAPTGARTLITEALEERPSARGCQLMAEVLRAQGASAASVNTWQTRALSAPREPLASADGEPHLTRKGWSKLVHSFGDEGRLAWAELEAEENLAGFVTDGSDAAGTSSDNTSEAPAQFSAAPESDAPTSANTADPSAVKEAAADVEPPEAAEEQKAEAALPPEIVPTPAGTAGADGLKDKEILGPPRRPDDPGPPEPGRAA